MAHKTWEEMSLTHFYAIEKLRIAVFVVEQNCPYQDLDDKDKRSHHIFALSSQRVCHAYARLVEPGISYEEPSIGRVLTSKAARMQGLGKELMHRTLDLHQKFYPNIGSRISAQCYLTRFYESFGYKQVGEQYLEDDIPHIQMFRK